MLSIGVGDLASVPKILESTSGRQLKPLLAIANSGVLVPAATKVSIQEQSNLESFAGHTFTITTAAKPATTPIVLQKYDDEVRPNIFLFVMFRYFTSVGLTLLSCHLQALIHKVYLPVSILLNFYSATL